MNNQENDEYELSFEVFYEEEERYVPADVRFPTLYESFAYGLSLIFPDCEYHFSIKKDKLLFTKYSYDLNGLDTCSEEEIEYNEESMTSYFQSIPAKEDSRIINLHIRNWTKSWEEFEKQYMNQIHDSTDDVPF